MQLCSHKHKQTHILQVYCRYYTVCSDILQNRNEISKGIFVGILQSAVIFCRIEMRRVKWFVGILQYAVVFCRIEIRIAKWFCRYTTICSDILRNQWRRVKWFCGYTPMCRDSLQNRKWEDQSDSVDILQCAVIFCRIKVRRPKWFL